MGKEMLAHAGLDEPQRLVSELIIVTFPPILTHTKEPHLRSSNLNFFSPTIGVRFVTSPNMVYNRWTSKGLMGESKRMLYPTAARTSVHDAGRW